MSESEIVRAERLEQNAGPEPRRRFVRAEEYDEWGGLVDVTAWRLHRDVPEPADPWEPFTCDHCAETYNGTFCTHGRYLCASCTAIGCQSCACEEADALAIAQERYEEWHR